MQRLIDLWRPFTCQIPVRPASRRVAGDVSRILRCLFRTLKSTPSNSLLPDLGQARLGIHHHRPELADLERLPALAHPHLRGEGKRRLAERDAGSRPRYTPLEAQVRRSISSIAPAAISSLILRSRT